VGSSSTRQSEGVLVSVASPPALGAGLVAPRAAWRRAPGLRERTAVGATARAGTAVAAAPIRTKRRCSGARRARRCRSTRARSPAGASTSAAALRASATARCCSASRSAGSGEAATRASSAARRPGASEPSASAASAAVSLTVGLVFSTRSHRHARSNADAALGRRGRLIGAAVVAGRSRLSRAEGLHTVDDPGVGRGCSGDPRAPGVPLGRPRKGASLRGRRWPAGTPAGSSRRGRDRARWE
jgi:hypothetical protein